MTPNYKKIYTDILNERFPDKKEICLPILEKEILSSIDILKVNSIIFGKSKMDNTNSKHKSYDEKSVKNILEYQKLYKLNNKEVAESFSISRNTIAKWKKMYQLSL